MITCVDGAIALTSADFMYKVYIIGALVVGYGIAIMAIYPERKNLGMDWFCMSVFFAIMVGIVWPAILIFIAISLPVIIFVWALDKINKLRG